MFVSQRQPPPPSKRKRAQAVEEWVVDGHSTYPEWEMPLPRANLIRMLETRDKDVVFENHGFRRRSSMNWYEGLTKLISKLFCGDPIMFASDAPQQRQQRQQKRKKKKRKKADDDGLDPDLVVSRQEREDADTARLVAESCSSGREQGLFVDQQLTAIINNVRVPLSRRHRFNYAKECTVYWTSECEHIRIGGGAVMRHVHPFAALVLSRLLDRGLVPVIAQLPVFHEEHNVATAADQVWWDPRQKRWVIVEVKCEKKANFLIASVHPALVPFQDTPNTSRLRAMIQLALTASMAQRCYPVIESPACLLVRVHAEGPIEVESLDPLVADRVGQMWNQFLLVM